MKFVLSSVLATFLLTVVCAAKAQPVARDSVEYEDYAARIRALPVHKMGYFHLADDGVARSMGPNNEVLGFVAASPGVLARYIAEAPLDQRVHLESVWEGIDGRDVADPWTIERDLISPSKRSITNRRDVLYSADIVLRDLSSPLHKRSCSTAGKQCKDANPDCINFEHPEDNCVCWYFDEAHFGNCLAN